MKLSKGQAVRISLLILHQFGHFAMLVLLLTLVLFGWLGFQLSKGPVAVPHLASWFATHLTGEGIDVRVSKAELAWSGYHQGGIVPFVLQLAGIEVKTDSGQVLANVSAATLFLPTVDLFGGRKPVILKGEDATFPYSNVPVSWYAQLWPGAGFTLAHSDVHVNIGAGRIGKGQDSVALDHASFILSVLHDGSVNVTNGQARLKPKGHSAPNLTFSFTGRYRQGWQGLLHIEVDKVQAQDLTQLWPPVLLPATRQWITSHIPSGDAEDANFTFGLDAGRDLSHFQIKSLHGQFKINDIALIWLTGAPPLTHVNGIFAMPNLDTGLITASSGGIEGVSVQNGTLRISGLAGETQSGILKMELAGPMQNVLTVLETPSLSLLGHVPDEIKEKTTGVVQASVQADIPFKIDVTKNEVIIKIQAQVSHLRIPTPLPGIFLTNGQVSLQSDGHKLRGTAVADLAGYPVSLRLAQNLSQSDDDTWFHAAGRIGPAVWRALGLDLSYVSLQGAVPFVLTVKGVSDDRQQADLQMDLTPASFSLPVLGWGKKPGDTGELRASFTLRKQKLDAVQEINIQAPGLFVHGYGTIDHFTLQQARIGDSQISGTLTRPSAAGAPWVLQGKGDVLDLRLKSLLGQGAQQNAALTAMGASPWRLGLAFTKIYIAAASSKSLVDVKLTAHGKGSELTAAKITAQGVSAAVTPASGGEQSLSLHADNAGTFLDMLGIYSGMRGGVLSLQALFGNGPTHGTLKLDNARLIYAPGFTKIMEAATLYGVVEALSGPGLLLDHVTVPFTLKQNIISLHEADAYSQALGFTASGTVNIGNGTCDLDTTIIPAYALNAFLGKIPLIGHIFTAEKGGGLFAMRAHVKGQIDDPQVTVNPLSVFVPGFLRGVFGLGAPVSKTGGSLRSEN